MTDPMTPLLAPASLTRRRKSTHLESVTPSFWVEWDELDFHDNRELGSGGFGTVELANHKNWGTVAVKQTLYKALTEEKKLQIEKEAAKMLQAVSCTNVVTVMGVAQDPNHASEGISIIMEYMKEGNLKKLTPMLQDGVMWPLRVRMIYDMILGMNFLHTMKPEPLVHCDLKLENVFVTQDFVVKIGDLGLTCSKTSCGNMGNNCSGMSGTFTHMPPEVLAGKCPKGWDPRTWDVWSFAITLFEFLSNEEEPWQFFVTEDLLHTWLNKRDLRPDIESIPDGTPPRIIEIMRTCWHKDPLQRPTFQELKSDFSSIYERQFEGQLSEAMSAVWSAKNYIQKESDIGTMASNPSTDNSPTSVNPPVPSQLHGEFQSLRSSTPISYQSKRPSAHQQPVGEVGRTGSSSLSIHQPVRDQARHSSSQINKVVDRSRRGAAPISSRELPSPDQESNNVTIIDGKPSAKHTEYKTHSLTTQSAIQRPMHVTSLRAPVQEITPNRRHNGHTNTMLRVQRQRSRSASPRPPSQKTSVNKSNKAITNNDILKIETYIGRKYRILGRHLSISDSDIEMIELQYRDFGPQEIVHQLLVKWRGKNGSKATKSVLASALCKASLSYVAEKL